MPAFLSLIPIKDWLYGGAIIALLIGFLCFIRHERAIGAAAVAASDQKAVAAQVERDQAVQAVASVATQLAQVNYEHTIASPPVSGVAPINCVRHDPRGNGTVSAPPAGNGSGENGPVSGGGNTPGAIAVSGPPAPDLATELVTIGRNADAQIKALQDIVAALRSEMENANAPGK